MIKTDHIALFGGSFDPIHEGHLIAAQQAYQHVRLKEIWFTPCFLSPFKTKTFYSNGERLTRIKKALQHTPYFKIWEYEMQNHTPSYTYDTVQYFKKNYAASLSLILGLDSFLTFPSWYRAAEIWQNVCLIVVNRPNVVWTSSAHKLLLEHQIHHSSPVNGKIIWLDVVTPDLSSSQLRN